MIEFGQGALTRVGCSIFIFPKQATMPPLVGIGPTDVVCMSCLVIHCRHSPVVQIVAMCAPLESVCFREPVFPTMFRPLVKTSRLDPARWTVRFARNEDVCLWMAEVSVRRGSGRGGWLVVRWGTAWRLQLVTVRPMVAPCSIHIAACRRRLHASIL